MSQPVHPPESPADFDPIRLEIFRNLFSALTEEMGASLRRAAFSPNIKERRDYSCALFDRDARPVALGDHMPVHLGAMPASVTAAIEALDDIFDGDVVIVNDPFHGGTHLPDVTLVAPIYIDGVVDGVVDGAGGGAVDAVAEGASGPMAWVAARAHHSDVGGMSPGSMPLAREIVQEGLRIPPVRLMAAGERCDDVWRLVLANVRTPEEREGDLDAQLGALHAGTVRFREIVARRGPGETRRAMDALLAYADRLLEAAIERIPDGVLLAEDVIEDDGFGSGPVPIRVRIEIDGRRMHVDFRDSADQTTGGVNAVRAITESATRYVLRCLAERLLETPLPAGGGSLGAVLLSTRPGSIVDARPPASVAAGNVETSQRITDVLLRALQSALPDMIPALSQGTMNNLTAGGVDPRSGRPFAYYETMGGGIGAGPAGPGMSGVHSHMSNSLNTPVEALEHAYPFRIERYAIRRGSGGPGRHRGGDGLIRDLRILADARIGLLTERRSVPPAGAAGGGPGRAGRCVRVDASGREHELPSKATLDIEAGDVVSLHSPGGGGWGAIDDPPYDLGDDPGNDPGSASRAGGTSHQGGGE